MENINFQLFKLKPKYLILWAILLLAGTNAFAQPSGNIIMKLQLMNDTTGMYGVYVRATPGTNPTNTQIASGQVTIVAPTGFQYTNFSTTFEDPDNNEGGSWEDDFTRVNAPPENPNWDYISIGFVGDSGTQLVEGEEVLLFTFERVGPCPVEILHLIENGNDPFDIPNNSENTVPGNEITFVDYVPGLPSYQYHSNYNLFASDCNDCDGDGLSNAEEDTNGDGVYTPGVDVSDMCDICDPFHPETAELSLQGFAENGIICADDLTDTAFLFVVIEGGWPPYTITYTDGTDNFVVTDYNSNDTIKITPSASASYSLVSLVDSEGCVADISGLGGIADVTVEGPINIDVDPVSLSECSDNGSGFSATVSNAGEGTISYLWQISTDNGASFVDLQDGTPYSDVMTNSMSISDVAGLNDYQYRVKVWTAVCDTTFSAAAVLSVEGPLSFTSNPQDVTECGTNGTSFTAVGLNSGVGTMNSVWQISTDNGANFADLANGGIYSGVTTGTLNISNTEGLNGYLYRMRIFTVECADVFSEAALLTVEGPFTITTQPVADSNCGGEIVTFIIVVDNPAAGTVLYQWQQNDGSGWSTLTNDGDLYNGVTTDTLSISDISGMNGDLIRVRISSAACDIIISDEAPITEEGSVEFTNNPDDFTTCDGSAASFTVEANTGGLNTPTYVWQLSTDDGVTFTDLSDGGVYSNTDELTLNISDVANLYDNRYRLKGFSGLCDTTFSSDAVLTVEGPLSIDVDPVSQTICSGDNASFPSTITNAGSGEMTIQWQVSTDNGGLWSDIPNNDTYNGVNSDNLSITNVEGLNLNQYRIQIESGTCATLTSAAALLTVDGPITYSDQPDDVQICDDGTAVSFSAATVNATGNGAETYQWQVSTDGINFADIPAGAPYSNLTTTTMGIADVTGLNAHYYRLATSLGVCATPYYSEAALLTVEGPISVDVDGDPDDVTLCADEPVNFIIEANSNGLGELIYQWQEFDGTNWTNVVNDLVYNGTGTDTLSINNLTGLNGYRYRVIMTTIECTDQVISESALLTLEGPVTYSDNPDDVQVCDDGTTISFSATPDNGNSGSMTYQWEVSNDGGVTFAPVPVAARYQNTNTTTMTITNVNGLNGRLYRLATSLPTCADFHSEAALLTVEVPVSVVPGGHPDNVTACSGEPITFIVEGTTGGLGDILYQWQVNDGSGWENVNNGPIYNGVSSDTLSVGDIIGLDGFQYRVLLNTPECGTSVPSNAAALTVEGPLVFTVEPEDYDQCSGLAAFFEVEVENLTGNGTTVYQWQENDGTGWSDLNNSGVYSGIALDRLDISNVAGLGAYEYRVVIGTTTCVADTSISAVLNVEGPLSITTQPIAVTECSGEANSFSVTVANPGSGGVDEINYQWYISFDATNWTALPNNDIYNGVNTDILSISDVAGLDFAQFQVEASTANCSFVTSIPVSLTVEGPLEFTDNPDNSIFCNGGAATTFEASVINNGVGTMVYQWQVSTDGVNFADLTDGSIYSGVNTTTLTVLDPTGLSGRLYRLAAGTGECAYIYSDAAEMVIEGPITIDDQPDDITTCSDLGQYFAVEANNAGEGFVFYQWQENDGSGWTDLGNDGNFNGVRTDTMSIDVTAGLGGHQYRVRVWTPTCDTLESDFATLTVEGPLSFTDEPDDVTICSGSSTSFNVLIANPGAGTPTYQWEISTNGGQTFTDISDGGVYSGATTATLNVSDVAGLNGFKYRSTIQTGECATTESYAATLVVEGPITFNGGPFDESICSNVGHVFAVDVINPGVGTLDLQWQTRPNASGTWADIANDANFTGVTTRELRIDLTDGLNGSQYRLVTTTSVCSDMSPIATLTVRDACLDGTCDFDLDGVINDTDEDDDDDGLDDVWEDYITDNSFDMLGIQITMDNCNPDSDGDGITDDQEDPDGDGINNGEETDDDGVSDGDPLDPCDPILSDACIGISLDLKVMLHGALLDTDGTLMRDDLRVKGLIPTTEPYTAMTGSFMHVGEGGGETVDPSVFDVTGPDAIVDWVFVELRDADQVENVIATRAALLQRDGDIKDLDGTSFLGFQIATAGNYYIAVRHRNHLGVMTNFAFGLSPITQTFDFTDILTKTYGANAQKVFGTSRTAMWCGDVNSNGSVIYQGPDNDVLTMFLTVLSDSGNAENLANYVSDGYYTTDINLDGRTIYQGPANDRNFISFQTVFSHPANTDFFANFVVWQQIPE